MLNKNYTYAIIGASRDIHKYGYRVFVDLYQAGYQVIPINPRSTQIYKQKTYPDIISVPQKIDVAVFVVPPHVTEKILPKLANKHIKQAWFQPGSSNAKILTYCNKHNINYINNACIMLSRQK